jgi:hypothetical protein
MIIAKGNIIYYLSNLSCPLFFDKMAKKCFNDVSQSVDISQRSLP